MRRSPLLDATSAIGSSGAYTLLLALAGVVLARALGPAGKGIATLVAVIGMRATLLLTLGVDTALIHYAGTDRLPLRSLSTVALRLGSLLGLISTATAGVLMWTVFRHQIGANLLVWTIPTLVCLPGMSIALNLASLVRAQGRLIEVNAVALGGALLMTASAIVVLIAGWGPGPYLALAAVSRMIETTAMFVLARRSGVLLRARAGEKASNTELIRYGLRGHVGTIFQGVNERLDVVLLALFVSVSDVGLYSVAVAAAEGLGIFSTPLSSVLLQRGATETKEDVARLTGAASRLTSMIVALGSLGLVLLATPLVRITFGSRFIEAAEAIRYLLPGIWALSLWRIIVQALAGFGHPGARSVSAGVGAVLTIGLDLLLIPRFGIVGAGMASSVAYVAAFLVVAWIARSKLGPELGNLVIPQPRDFALLLSSARSLMASARSRTGATRVIAPSDPNDPRGD